MTPKNFTIGDRVQHMCGSVGRVTKVTDAVTVDFGKPGYRGEYDEPWFRAYPDGLKIIKACPIPNGERG